MRLIDADALMRYIERNHSYSGLPMAAHICTMELLTYAPTVDAVEEKKALEWLEWYAFTDSEQVYTNGTVLVPMFRVRQALEDRAYNGLFEV